MSDLISELMPILKKHGYTEDIDLVFWLDVKLGNDESISEVKWSSEVFFIFNRVFSARNLSSLLQNKIKSHINRLLLHHYPMPQIIEIVEGLVNSMENKK
ncbi:hypothetical protein [Dickeya sp. NCPPB 3274]|uniref:hypothetical protein n=1 Tax=Dickeya sp. NCPPB 3274 TaxID=568766 RepID=UPI0005B319A2|nr:hypothetical protein [Dickeya sp. NCPPB 3274]